MGSIGINVPDILRGITEEKVDNYFKDNEATLKGIQGDKGDTGNHIVSFEFVESTDNSSSSLDGQYGAVDYYRVVDNLGNVLAENIPITNGQSFNEMKLVSTVDMDGVVDTATLVSGIPGNTDNYEVSKFGVNNEIVIMETISITNSRDAYEYAVEKGYINSAVTTPQEFYSTIGNLAAWRDDVVDAHTDFSTRFLGVKSSHPVVDNLGDPLEVGAMYIKDTDKELYIFDGTSWKSPIEISAIPDITLSIDSDGNLVVDVELKPVEEQVEWSMA